MGTTNMISVDTTNRWLDQPSLGTHILYSSYTFRCSVNSVCKERFSLTKVLYQQSWANLPGELLSKQTPAKWLILICRLSITLTLYVIKMAYKLPHIWKWNKDIYYFSFLMVSYWMVHDRHFKIPLIAIKMRHDDVFLENSKVNGWILS